MNDHSLRLCIRMNQILRECIDGRIDTRDMLNSVEGLIGAIEERSVNKELERLLVKINDVIYLFDDADGKEQLKKIYDELLRIS